MTRNLEKKLLSCGFRLVRAKKHLVYRHTTGRVLVVSKTASDWMAEHKVMCDVRRILSHVNSG